MSTETNFPSNRIECESADGLSKTEFNFQVHVKLSSLIVLATLCSTATYARATRKSKWHKLSSWAVFNHAGASEKPPVPPEVLSEALHRLSTNLSVSG